MDTVVNLRAWKEAVNLAAGYRACKEPVDMSDLYGMCAAVAQKHERGSEPSGEAKKEPNRPKKACRVDHSHSISTR